MIDDILRMVKALLEERDKLYGDAFHKVWEEYNLTGTTILLTVKLNRLKNLAKKDGIPARFIKDTLLDIMGYCVLTLHEMTKRDIERKKHLLIEPHAHI